MIHVTKQRLTFVENVTKCNTGLHSAKAYEVLYMCIIYIYIYIYTIYTIYNIYIIYIHICVCIMYTYIICYMYVYIYIYDGYYFRRYYFGIINISIWQYLIKFHSTFLALFQCFVFLVLLSCRHWFKKVENKQFTQM